MLRKLFLTLILACVPVSSKASDIQSVLNTHIPDCEKVGEARYTRLLWDVYDASLFAKDGVYQQQQPFALSLHYLRNIEGKAIADKSAELIREAGFSDEITLAAWHNQMRSIFPNVSEGTVLTGIYGEGGKTVFYDGGKKIGQISDPKFGEHFFGIWLSEDNKEADFRKKLLGDL